MYHFLFWQRLGTDEDVLVELLATRTNEEIVEMRRVFKEGLKSLCYLFVCPLNSGFLGGFTFDTTTLVFAWRTTVNSETVQHHNQPQRRTVSLQQTAVTSAVLIQFVSLLQILLSLCSRCSFCLRVWGRPGRGYQGWNQWGLHHSPAGHAES